VLPTQPPLRLSAIALIAVTAFFAFAVHATSARAADPVALQVAQRINALRAQHGLRTLTLDHRLAAAGRFQSSAMMASRNLSHAANGNSGRNRLTRLCLRMHAKTVGETIGWIRYRSPAKQAAGIVRWWMNSPPHRAVLMSPTFNRIGVGRRTGRYGGHKVVWFSADLSG
jgi:uncharacterized protein YkwD